MRFLVFRCALVATLVVGAQSAQADVGFGDTLVANTTLTADLSGSGTALVVGADGITIDLNGHTITGDGTTGFGIDNSGGYANVTIKNGTIKSFAEGVHAEEADGLSIESLTVIGANGPASTTGAIHVLDSVDVSIEDCTIVVAAVNAGPHGIRLDSVTDAAVEDCDIEGGFVGISFFSVGGNAGLGDPTTGHIEGCTIADSFSSCILLGNTDDAVVEDNDLSGAASGMQIGIHSANLLENIVVSDNDVHHNGGGLFCPFLTDSEISGNNISNNGSFGILLRSGAARNVVSGNTVNANAARGIVLIFGTHDNLIEDNVVNRNGFDGISLFLGVNTGNVIKGNTARNNGVWDLFHNAASTPNTWEDNTFKTSSGADIP